MTLTTAHIWSDKSAGITSGREANLVTACAGDFVEKQNVGGRVPADTVAPVPIKEEVSWKWCVCVACAVRVYDSGMVVSVSVSASMSVSVSP